MHSIRGEKKSCSHVVRYMCDYQAGKGERTVFFFFSFLLPCFSLSLKVRTCRSITPAKLISMRLFSFFSALLFLKCWMYCIHKLDFFASFLFHIWQLLQYY